MRTVFLLFLGITASLHAADITLTDGTVFRNATATPHNQKTTQITFAGGVALVKTEMIIPADLISTSAAPATNAPPAPPPPLPAPEPVVPINPAIRPAVDRGVWSATGRIIQVDPDGVVTRLQGSFNHIVIVPHTEKNTVNLVPEGLGHTPVYQTENHTWTTEEMVTDKIDLGIGFVACPTADLVEGQEWNGKIWRIGVYSCTDENDGRHLVAKYTTKATEAYAYFSANPNKIPSPSQPPSVETTDQTLSPPKAVETPDGGPTINSTSDSLTVPSMK